MEMELSVLPMEQTTKEASSRDILVVKGISEKKETLKTEGRSKICIMLEILEMENLKILEEYKCQMETNMRVSSSKVKEMEREPTSIRTEMSTKESSLTARKLVTTAFINFRQDPLTKEALKTANIMEKAN